uniref:Uncharacterized protein n=1 Tax=Verrucosispora sp. MS100047 TaxID=1410949 RepID=A0A097CRT4_9ACTN|nr:hypothetical protein VASRM7_107 [Verrucosispora sp. MS100047]
MWAAVTQQHEQGGGVGRPVRRDGVSRCRRRGELCRYPVHCGYRQSGLRRRCRHSCLLAHVTTTLGSPSITRVSALSVDLRL